MKRLAAVLIISFYAVAARPQPPTLPFAGGETLDFSLAWLSISGGSARMTIGSDPADTSRLRITSIARSTSSFARIFKVRDEIVSTVSRDRFSTLHYEKHLNERGHTKNELTDVDPATGIATRKGKSIHVPTPVFDPLSLIYHLRTLDLTVGRTQRFTVLADGKVYTLEANVIRRETLKSDAGTFSCVVVEPKMAGGDIFRDEEGQLLIWYSDEARHLPVRIESKVKVGTITANLRGVTAGVSDPEPR